MQQAGACFSAPQVLWARDVFMGGNRGCDSRLDAQLLRSLVYAQYGLPAPPFTYDSQAGNATTPPTSAGFDSTHGRTPVVHAESAELAPRLPGLPPGQPLRILLQRKSANRRLVNEAEMVEVLRGFGEVRPPRCLGLCG